MPIQMAGDRWADVIFFDGKVLDLGRWNPPLRKKLEGWTKILDLDKRREGAAAIAPEMIKSLMGEYLGDKGMQKSQELGKRLRYFEEMIIIARVVKEKPYRDHLNHMVRVSLLANVLGSVLHLAELTPRKRKFLTLIGLMHDMAYPLAETSSILDFTIEAVQNCYTTIDFSKSLPNYNMDLVFSGIQKVTPSYCPPQFFSNHLVGREHHVIGALEFLDYAKPGLGESATSDINLAAQAIALHDKGVKTKVMYSTNPLAALLILCDELQEWGRPVGLDRDPVIPQLSEFEISPESIRAGISFAKNEDEGRSKPLGLMESKWENFSRLRFDRPFPRTRYSIELPTYLPASLSAVERRLHDFFDSAQARTIVEPRRLVRFLVGMEAKAERRRARILRSKVPGASFLDQYWRMQNTDEVWPQPLSGNLSTLLSGSYEQVRAGVSPRSQRGQTVHIDSSHLEIFVTTRALGIPSEIRFTRLRNENRFKAIFISHSARGKTREILGELIVSHLLPSRLQRAAGAIGVAMVIADLSLNSVLRRKVLRASLNQLESSPPTYSPHFELSRLTSLFGLTDREASSYRVLWEARQIVESCKIYEWGNA